MSKGTYEGRMPTIDDFCNPEPQEEMFPGFPCFLFTPEDLEFAKSRQLLPYRCTGCGKTFYIPKNSAQAFIKRNLKTKYCSSECCNRHRKELHKKVDKDYICEVCGKHVSADKKYGEGRFCSVFCSRHYSSTCGNREEINKQVSIKLKEYYKTHPGPNLGKTHQKPQETMETIYNTIKECKEQWNLNDILQLKFADPYYRRYALKTIKHYNLQDNPKFASSKWPLFIQMCRTHSSEAS